MSEVLIVLKLRRRSGVLAATVAAVHRAGLEFQSQRMVDADDEIQLHLKTEGEVASVEFIVETMSAVSGVSEVADILIDEVSLMHLAPDPEPEPEPVLESGTLQAPEPIPEPEAELDLEPASESKPEPEPAPAPAPEPEIARSRPAAQPDLEDKSAGDPSMLTATMLRRRRRRR